ncbi:DUF1680 domain-containing protein [Fusarium pseudocircinatum]|uniref:DUF1680 domain-containing protein n=1 Tax=Fusarium pseudocircinatum TaxID=56676 RepID=A0A8H5KJP7_9HYPO|nr:DUF1680 domain-containing protein [Fusarium pseudocircinatum]
MSYPQTTHKDTKLIAGTILHARRTTFSRTTIRTQLDQLKSTGRYDCFKLKWHPIYDDNSVWPIPLHQFWDSDVAKWIEGACYFLQHEHDPEIDEAVQDLVSMIRSAQKDNGYLNVHYTVVQPGKQWTNLEHMHELYNAGHLIEAALAHYHYYKNNLLLEPILKYVALIRQTFGPSPQQIHGYPGHPEIELSLLRLYSATHHKEAYDLARYFLEERGNPVGQDGLPYFEWEARGRGDSLYKRPDSYPEHGSYWYCQAHQPILQQQTIEGHSVRAVYLLIAVADLIRFDKDAQQPLARSAEWRAAVDRLWNNMVDRKMYLTGGIGAIKQWEGFSRDYFLPQSTDEGGCYAETCASIAVIMLAERLLKLDLHRRYTDILELSLYNNVMTAMSLNGKSFTYVNQMGSSDTDKSERHDWFDTACCPPNLLRLFGTLGGYLWDYGQGEHRNQVYINVHLYTSAEVHFSAAGGAIRLKQRSQWPWKGTTQFELSAPSTSSITLRLRIPAWSNDNFTLLPTPNEDEVTMHQGYVTLSPAFVGKHSSFSLEIGGLNPRYIAPHPYTGQQAVAITRGPLVYCAEDIDNSWEQNHFKDVGLKVGTPIYEEERVFDDGNGTRETYIALKTTCWKRKVKHQEPQFTGLAPGVEMQSGKEFYTEKSEIVLVPYYLRSNRGGKGHMRVALNRVA